MTTTKTIFRLFFLSAFLISSSKVISTENDAQSNAKTEIERVLRKWPQDFNAKNIKAVCDLFAPDLVATFPGTPDRDYEQMCRQLTAVLTNPEKSYRYEPPHIEQILIQGDLAVVRLVWTLKVADKDQSKVEVTRERGMDVLRRQKDGTWKIAISYAYPET